MPASCLQAVRSYWSTWRGEMGRSPSAVLLCLALGIIVHDHDVLRLMRGPMVDTDMSIVCFMITRYILRADVVFWPIIQSDHTVGSVPSQVEIGRTAGSC